MQQYQVVLPTQRQVGVFFQENAYSTEPGFVNSRRCPILIETERLGWWQRLSYPIRDDAFAQIKRYYQEIPEHSNWHDFLIKTHSNDETLFTKYDNNQVNFPLMSQEAANNLIAEYILNEGIELFKQKHYSAALLKINAACQKFSWNYLHKYEFFHWKALTLQHLEQHSYAADMYKYAIVQAPTERQRQEYRLTVNYLRSIQANNNRINEG